MVSLSPRMLRHLVVARRRPRGFRLGRLSARTVAELLAFHERNRHIDVVGDALADRAARSLPVEDPARLSEQYSQVELQRLRKGGDRACRRDFVDPVDPSLMEDIEGVVGPCHRSRTGALKPGGVIPRHVDDPEQIRVISVLSGSHEFRMFDRSGEALLPMDTGELWFVNTAREHEVANRGTEDRIALLLNLFEMPGGPDA